LAIIRSLDVVACTVDMAVAIEIVGSVSGGRKRSKLDVAFRRCKIIGKGQCAGQAIQGCRQDRLCII